MIRFALSRLSVVLYAAGRTTLLYWLRARGAAEAAQRAWKGEP